MRALAVPHPLAVAGTPAAYHFERDSSVFRAAWTVARVGAPGHFRAGSRTRIAVPRLVYGHGYDVRVTGGRVVSAPGARTLVVAQGPGADRVRVVVRPH